MSDTLITMFDELRAELPPLVSFLADADARDTWLTHMGQVVRAMPPDRQWKCVALVASDLCATRYPGLPLEAAYRWLIREFQLDSMDAILEEES